MREQLLGTLLIYWKGTVIQLAALFQDFLVPSFVFFFHIWKMEDAASCALLYIKYSMCMEFAQIPGGPHTFRVRSCPVDFIFDEFQKCFQSPFFPLVWCKSLVISPLIYKGMKNRVVMFLSHHLLKNLQSVNALPLQN